MNTYIHIHTYTFSGSIDFFWAQGQDKMSVKTSVVGDYWCVCVCVCVLHHLLSVPAMEHTEVGQSKVIFGLSL